MASNDRLAETFASLATATLKKEPIPAGWIWPVAPIKFSDGVTYHPVISDGFSAQASPGKREHRGIDVAFRRKSANDRRAEYPPNTQSGTPGYFSPPNTPIVAGRQAVVWSVAEGPKGWNVVLSHGKPYATFYQHLARVIVEPKQIVKAGEQIGTMGSSRFKGAWRHLHFAVWYKGFGDGASIDPAPSMKTWRFAPSWNV